MDFGKTLDRWERGSAGDTNAALAAWLDAHGVEDKDAGAAAGAAEGRAERARRVKEKAPDARLDLHGKTADEAWRALEDFFGFARARRLEKVLLIHGKGRHSKAGGVLKEICRVYVKQCPFARESGQPDDADGGAGATWVALDYNFMSPA
jgi:DNA-nicking Smr family endonuclease